MRTSAKLAATRAAPNLSAHKSDARDLFSIAGIVLAVAAVAGAQVAEGGTLSSLVNVPALIVVLGGTLGAAVAQVPWPVFALAVRRVEWVIRAPDDDRRRRIEKVLNWCTIARRDGILTLERRIDQETDPLARKGLQLIVDGAEERAVRESLTVSLQSRESQDMAVVRVFEAMGGYAPTIGILGAVMGLVQAMEHLQNPGLLGVAIARAFVATIYGVAFANILLLPWANRLKALVVRRSQSDELLIDGLAAIAARESVSYVETKLTGYVEDRA